MAHDDLLATGEARPVWNGTGPEQSQQAVL